MVLRLTKPEGFTRLECLAVMFYVLAEVNADLFARRIVYILAVALLALTIIPHISLRFIKNRTFVQWAIPWFLVVVISISYSVIASQTVTSVLTLGARFLVMLLLIQRINGNRDMLIELIKLLIIAQLINTLYILAVVDRSVLGRVQLGRSIDEQWNSNSIGITLAYTSFAIFVLLYRKMADKKSERIILFLILTLFVVIVLLTGSRKALFIIAFSILLYYLLSANLNSFLPRLLLVVLVLMIGWWLIMNVDALYNVLGVRVERLVNIFFFGSDVRDISINSRRHLIQMGVEWIKERPIFGYGMNTFLFMCGNATGRYWYAHNNYIEVAVGTGLVGIVAYYWVFIRFLQRSLSKVIDSWRIVLTLAVIILVNDYGTVSYKMFTVQFCIMVMMILIEMPKQNT